jgi:hypothetical protein
MIGKDSKKERFSGDFATGRYNEQVINSYTDFL